MSPRPLDRITSSSLALLPWAFALAVKRVIMTRYITLRMWLLDEELARIRDKAIEPSMAIVDHKKLEELCSNSRTAELREERSRLVRLTYGFGEVYGLKLDRRLRRRALKYGVISIPQRDGAITNSEITNTPRLNAIGVSEGRESIRREKKARREPWMA